MSKRPHSPMYLLITVAIAFLIAPILMLKPKNRKSRPQPMRRLLVLNVVSIHSQHAVATLQAMLTSITPNLDLADDVFIFSHQESYTLAGELIPKLSNLSRTGVTQLMTYNRSRAKDTSIDKIRVDDDVTPILDSLMQLSSMSDQLRADYGPTVLVSLAWSNDSQAVPTGRIRSLYESLAVEGDRSAEIMLLRKVFRLTSLSDWHDLQVIGLTISNAHVRRWIQILDETFVEYSDRKVFNMIEPRPAILEANKQMSKLVHIKRMRSGYICAYNTNAVSATITSNCNTSKASIKINCVRRRQRDRVDPCSAVDNPRLWMKRLSLDKFVKLEEKIGSNLNRFFYHFYCLFS